MQLYLIIPIIPIIADYCDDADYSHYADYADNSHYSDYCDYSNNSDYSDYACYCDYSDYCTIYLRYSFIGATTNWIIEYVATKPGLQPTEAVKDVLNHLSK